MSDPFEAERHWDAEAAQHADTLAMQKQVLEALIYMHHMAAMASHSQRTKDRTLEAAKEIAAALGMSKEFTGE